RWARRSAQRVLPQLLDLEGAPFTYTLPDALLELSADITSRASGQIAISEQVTNASTRDRYLVDSLIEEAITSSQLEGAVTSRRVAKEMLRSGRRPRNHSEQMIFNNYLAMRRIVELGDADLTPELVCEIHRIVTAKTLEDETSAGRIQSDDADRVAVWAEDGQLLHRPPPVAELPMRMNRLCAFANGQDAEAYLPPVLRAIAIHFMVGYDHYFEDGNGRTARALFYWSMLREGFWLTEFLTISKILKDAPAQYARSFLLTEQDDGDLTYFFLYHLGVISRAIDDLHRYLAVKAAELADVHTLLRSHPGKFNHRQLVLLEHAASHPGAVFTALSHATSHNVTPQSARNDLAALEEAGILVRFRQGRQHAWTPAGDVADLVANLPP
ncbi:MAG: Fic family protein, partial [Actinomycetia bacterium]|nr:Fic family protein [Actinomycetes bacterium]